MTDEPKLEAVQDEPEAEAMEYQVVLIVGMNGIPGDAVHTELMTKLTVLTDAMRTRFPDRELPAAIKDYIMSAPERQI